MADDITFDELKAAALEVLGMKPRGKRLPLTPEQREIEAEYEHKQAQEAARVKQEIMIAMYGEDGLRDMLFRRQSFELDMKRGLQKKIFRLRNGQRKRRR